MTFHKVTLAFCLFVATFSVANFTAAQNKNKPTPSCEKILSEATTNYSAKNFATATSLFLKSESICNEFNTENYKNLISSIKNSINQAQNQLEKTTLIDTLIVVYKRA
jgi:hypothetical protein